MVTTVVVIFYSRDGETERLAHAAAVGAVQARALIRLRRVADAGPQPGVSEAHRRMLREYVAPKEADIVAADALVIASRADADAASPEWASVVEMLERLHAAGKLAGKAAAVVPNDASSRSFEALISRLGLARPALDSAGGDAAARAVALGRAVVGVVGVRPR